MGHERTGRVVHCDDGDIIGKCGHSPRHRRHSQLAEGLYARMIGRGGGAIVNVTSMVATKGVPGASTYSASKAAVESLTRTWAIEFGQHNIRVNNVAPGPTATEGVAAEWGETNDELGRALPLGRTAAPSEIAELISSGA